MTKIIEWLPLQNSIATKKLLRTNGLQNKSGIKKLIWF